MNFGKLTKIILIFAVLLITFSVFYYFVFFLPEKEKDRLELQKDKFRLELLESEEEQEKAQQNLVELESCLTRAEISYSEFWNSECEILGLKENCKLPEYNADRADDFKQKLKDECFKKYPQK